MQPFKEADVAQEHGDKSYLFDDLVRAMHRQPLHWRLVLIVGQPGDVTNDATIAWPEGRERIDVGTVTLDQLESDDTSPARVVNFDPLVLPAGMSPSDDPMLSARSAVYSQSFTRRVGEKTLPSAITPAEARKGE
jgi:catalase